MQKHIKTLHEMYFLYFFLLYQDFDSHNGVFRPTVVAKGKVITVNASHHP